jgi:hypothetical protein
VGLFRDQALAGRLQVIWDAWYSLFMILKSKDPLNERMRKPIPSTPPTRASVDALAASVNQCAAEVEIAGGAVSPPVPPPPPTDDEALLAEFDISMDDLDQDDDEEYRAFIQSMRYVKAVQSLRQGSVPAKSRFPREYANTLNTAFDRIGSSVIDFEATWEDIGLDCLENLAVLIRSGQKLPQLPHADAGQEQSPEPVEMKDDPADPMNATTDDPETTPRLPKDLHVLALRWLALFVADAVGSAATNDYLVLGYSPKNVTP